MYHVSGDNFEKVTPEGPLLPRVPEGMPWLEEAARMVDESGKIGLSTTRRRVRFAHMLDSYTPVSLPWCGLFVGHCLDAGLGGIAFPPLHIRARPWLGWGVEAEPQVGALIIFWLKWEGSPFGHVGFYWGEDEDAYHLLGGNQHQSILIERFPKERLIGCRWPEGWAQPGMRRHERAEAVSPFEHGEVSHGHVSGG